MTLDPSTRRPLLLATLSFVVAGAISSHAAAQLSSPPPPPTHVASYTPTVFPDATGDFELGLPPASHQNAPAWLPWSMSRQSINASTGVVSAAGIANNGASLLANSSPAPQGSHVCFVRGVGSAQCTVPFQPGIWKLRFSAAQRVQGSTPDQQILRVTIGGITVFEQAPGATFTEFVTSTRLVTTAAPLQVRFVGLQNTTNANIALVDHIVLERELPWNDPASWSPAQVPGTSAKVRIEPGAEVVMDGACLAQSVEVQGLLRGGTVNASLEAMWVLVHGDAAQFRVGTEAVPFDKDFTLSLIGPLSGQDIMGGGTKFLMAMDGGTIEMHGIARRTWSKLSYVNAAGNVIRVVDPVLWHDGDRVVVTRTACMPNDATPGDAVQSEERLVTGYDPTNGDITLATALTHSHCSAAPTDYPRVVGQTTTIWTLDQRAEVGLLTHNVRVQARDDTDATVDKFGAHVMLMNCPMCSTPGSGRFSHVQFQRMGQQRRFGRYPLHWHMQLANGQGQYARGCSIWQSYNRAIVIHGSDYVTIEDNVCFDHVGHGIFLEDGGERHNRFLRNLVVRTIRPTQQLALLPHDASHNEPQNRSPAAFWITNPQNEFVGNVVADTVGTAYWFALHREPFNLSWAEPYFAPGGVRLDATKLPLGTFRDNVAHAVRTAIDLNDTVEPHTMTQPLQHDDTLVPNFQWKPSNAGLPVHAVMEGFVAHGCATALYSGTDAEPWSMDDVTFTDAVLADNEWHVQFACAFSVTESLFVAQSGNAIFAPTHPAYSGVAMVPYDGPARIVDSHWVGFHGTTLVSPMAVSTIFGASQRETNHLLSGITKPPGSPLFRIESLIDFAGATPPAFEADPRSWGIAILDRDGSVTGAPDLTLVTQHPMMTMPVGPHADAQYPLSTAVKPMFRSWYRWGYLRLQHFEPNDIQFIHPQPLMTFTRPAHDGCQPVTFTATLQNVDAHRQLPVIVRRAADTTSAECWYEVSWLPPSSSKELRVSVHNIAPGDVTTLVLRKSGGWSGPSVSIGPVALPPSPNQQSLAGLSSTAWAWNATDLHLRIVMTTPDKKVVIRWL